MKLGNADVIYEPIALNSTTAVDLTVVGKLIAVIA